MELSLETTFTEYQVFHILDRLKPTDTGLDRIPAWFLRLGAPIFAKVMTDLFNKSITNGIVPSQWKRAYYIRPVPKVANTTNCSDYRPISITPVMSRMMEKMVVRELLYPSLISPSSQLTFDDQFAFRPAGSTTAALIAMLQTISNLLLTNEYVIVIALDFSKAFDTVKHSKISEKLSLLDLPPNVYNWVINFLTGHTHCAKFNDVESAFRAIMASVIQGSGLVPFAYIVTASDLRPITAGNDMFNFADDSSLVIPASNAHTRERELEHIQQWASENKLSLNKSKSQENIFRKPPFTWYHRRSHHPRYPTCELS